MTETIPTSPAPQWAMAAGSGLYILGAILALFLLLRVTTAQVEVALSEINSGDPTLSDTRESLRNIQCPAAIGPTAKESITYSITNPVSTEQTARIEVYAGKPGSTRYFIQCVQTATFDPNQTRELSCDVSAAGIDGQTLAVEVPGVEVHCGMAIIDGPGGLDGMWALRVGFTASLLALLAGAGLWLLRHSPHGFFQWLRSILGILVIVIITIGASFTLFVTDVYWQMVASVFAFWGALILTMGLLILLAVEGIALQWATRRDNTSTPQD
ncbi:MAG: hypothetical protein JXA10_13020 [Anaerolineae bacterium]|nr:hypothetical protein [Anaerolineae bacterium]